MTNALCARVEGPHERRRLRGLPAEPIVNTVKSTEYKAKQKALLFWDDLPVWRRDNGFIQSGYRQNSPSYLHSLGSLFYLHNQSVNIWTHLVGAITTVAGSIYLYYVIYPRYENATLSDVLVFSCFLSGAVLCLGMSATFHVVLDHSREAAQWGNKLDYTGIVALIVGSHVPPLYYGFYCKPVLLKAYLCTVSLLSWAGHDGDVIDEHSDLSAGHGMRHSRVDRAVSRPRVAIMPRCNVHWPRVIRPCPSNSRHHHLRLQGI